MTKIFGILTKPNIKDLTVEKHDLHSIPKLLFGSKRGLLHRYGTNTQKTTLAHPLIFQAHQTPTVWSHPHLFSHSSPKLEHTEKLRSHFVEIL